MTLIFDKFFAGDDADAVTDSFEFNVQAISLVETSKIKKLKIVNKQYV